MSSTPPRASGTPEQQQYQTWLNEQIEELRGGVEVAQVRIQAVDGRASNANIQAASNAAAQEAIEDRVVATDSANRLARPLTDKGYWEDVQAGRRYVWEALNATSGVTNHSTWRNVSWNLSGALIFQPNGTIESAEAHITPILPIPTSQKIYVEAEYSPGFTPQIWIDWYDATKTLFVPGGALVSTLVASKGIVSTVAALAAGAVFYSVRLVRPAGLGSGATLEPKVFEVVGTNGMSISPSGVSVEDGSGNKTIEINPSLPVLVAPAVPALTSSVGSVSVAWNGNLTSGAAPAHLSYVYAEESVNGTTGWTRVGQPLNRAGTIITRPPVGATRWYRLIAVDTSNRPSPASATASITVVGVTIPDLGGDIGDVIDTVDGLNKIFYDVVTNPPVAHANADLWFVLDPGTSVVREVRIWNGSAWLPYRIVADSVIVPGSAGTITLADGAITGPKVATRTLTAEHIGVGTLGVDVLEPNIGSTLDIHINPAITDLESGLEEQQRYFRFGSNGLEIGDPATNESLRLDAGRIEMVQAGNVPTYWEAQTFYVERMIVEAANIGSHRFEGYANGRTVIRPLRGV